MARRSEPRQTMRPAPTRPLLPIGRVVLLAVTAVFAATVVVFAVMHLLTFPHLAEIAGSRPFDTRFLGYDRAAAVAFLKALGPIGRGEYLQVQLALDTVFPFLYGVSLSLILAEIFGRAGLSARLAFLAAILVVAPTAALDLAENAAIAEMLRRPPDAVGAELVAAASLRTTLKWAAALAGLAIAGLALLVAWRRSRRDDMQ